MIGGAGMTSLAQLDLAGVCPSPNGQAPLFAAADAPVNESVGAAALRPPLAALPLTAAAYPWRVLRPPSAALPLTAAAYPLRVFGGPFPWARPFASRTPYGAPGKLPFPSRRDYGILILQHPIL